ncbi:MAG: hypothetical protein QXW73_09940, partial [Nitrososphaerales archaeon]
MFVGLYHSNMEAYNSPHTPLTVSLYRMRAVAISTSTVPFWNIYSEDISAALLSINGHFIMKKY